MDPDNGKVLAFLPIGERVDALAFDPETQTIFTSNGEGIMTVIHEDSPDKFQVLQTVATQTGARTLALDVSKHQIWLVTAETKPAPENQVKKRRIVLPDTFAALVVGKN